MPLFKRLTPAEKEAKKQAKEQEQLRQEAVQRAEARAVMLEEEVFPQMQNEELKETIRNLDIELSSFLFFEDFELESLIKLDQIIQPELETLIGYSFGLSDDEDLTTDVFIVCTTLRIIFIVIDAEDADDYSAYTYNLLKSLDVERNELIDPFSLDTFIFKFNDITLQAYLFARTTDSLVGLIENAKASQDPQELQKIIFNSNIALRITDEKLVNTINNIKWELKYVTSDFACDSIAKLEHLLVADFEELLGYAIGKNPEFDYSDEDESLLVFTTKRVFFIDQYANGKMSDAFTYDKLNSVRVEKESISLFTPGYEYNLNMYQPIIQSVADALLAAKEVFMADPSNFKPTVDDNKVKVAVVKEKSATEQLNELKQLLYSRTINQDQYDSMKAKITNE